jgi:hypothetical protein
MAETDIYTGNSSENGWLKKQDETLMTYIKLCLYKNDIRIYWLCNIIKHNMINEGDECEMKCNIEDDFLFLFFFFFFFWVSNKTKQTFNAIHYDDKRL